MGFSGVAKKFIQELFEEYLVKRNFSKMDLMIYENISWFCPSGGKVSHGIISAKDVLENMLGLWDESLEITEYSSEALELEGGFCAVYGNIKAQEAKRPNEISVAIEGRFSAICKEINDKICLYHFHFSVPTDSKISGGYLYKKLADEYDSMLQEKLKEATGNLESVIRTLKVKNEELLLSETLYEIAMDHTETLVFDYDIVNNIMTNSHNTLEKYGFPSTIVDPVNTIIASGTIHENSIDEFRELYQKIQNGDPAPKVRVTVLDVNGEETLNEISLTNIYDDTGKPIRAIGVIRNISQISKMENEKLYRESLMSDKILLYEVDITRNEIEYVNAEWFNMVKTSEIKTYDDLINFICINIIHGEDVDAYREIANRANIIESISQKKFYHVVEYRRRLSDTSYNWVQGTFNIIQDEITGNIKHRCYVSQIDNKKKHELEILYQSEHDSLTELYNKGALAKKIKTYLSGEGKNGKHAFLLFDVDMFKQINDNFGHSFGDAVLSQVSRKVRKIFRDDDIIGRIGGDEFVVLMKNVPSQKMAMKKAKELCECVVESYTQAGKKYVISASVGIAMYKEHAMSYQKLYDRSDSAMYAVKKAGRNSVMMYEKNMEPSSEDYRDNVGEIVESKSFEKNVAEYIFKILHESSDKISAINSVIELVGKQYQASRVYIYEESAEGCEFCNTFEWCNEGIEPQKDIMQDISHEEIGEYSKNFNEHGVLYFADTEDAPENISILLKHQNVTSMLQFATYKNNRFVGMIGFDQCGFMRRVGRNELEELKLIANILGVFLVEMRVIAANENIKDMALSIVNGLNSYAYVIDTETHKLLFINDKAKSIATNAKAGDKCYRAFWDNEHPCNECAMRELVNGKSKSTSIMLSNQKFGVTVKATASWIPWDGEKKACLIDCFDVTELLKGNLETKEFLVEK